MRAAAAILALLMLAACGVKGPPARPSGATADATATAPAKRRTIIGASTSTEAPGRAIAAPKPERRFILDGLL